MDIDKKSEQENKKVFKSENNLIFDDEKSKSSDSDSYTTKSMPYSSGTTDEENENEVERTETFQELSPQNMKRFKIFLVFVSFFIFIMVVTVPSMSLEQVDCIKDSVTDFFNP